MKIYIVRHAEKEWEGENSPLTKKGVKQAKYLAKRLKKKKFDKFYCSDMIRTKQTAEIVSKKIKMKPVIEESFNEYETEDIKKDISKWTVGERKRVKELYKFIEKITKNPRAKKNVLIIAHGVTNRIIVARLLEMDLKKMIRMKQHETCVNVLKWSKNWHNWHLEKWNSQSHVPKRWK